MRNHLLAIDENMHDPRWSSLRRVIGTHIHQRVTVNDNDVREIAYGDRPPVMDAKSCSGQASNPP